MLQHVSTALIFAHRGLAVLRVLFLLLSLSLIPSLVENLRAPFAEDFVSLDNPRVRGQLDRLRAHLEGPKVFRGLEAEDRAHALTACALAAQSLWSLDRALADHVRPEEGRRKELRELMRNLAETALQPTLRPEPDLGVTRFPAGGGYSAYYGPVGVVLILHRLMTGNSRWDREIEEVAAYLWRESLRAPSGLIPPGPSGPQAPAFTADQSLVLHALGRLDELRAAPSPPAEPRWGEGPRRPRDRPRAPAPKKSARAKPTPTPAPVPIPGVMGKTPVVPRLTENPRRPWRLPSPHAAAPTPLRAFAQAMAQNPVSRRSGLHPAGINHEHADLPRGSSTAFELLQLARLMPEHTERQYVNFREQMRKRSTVGLGFREWPVGLERGRAPGTGALVWQMGAASTVYALGSARRFHDVETYDGVLRLTNWLGGYWELGSGRRYLWLDVPLRLMQVLRPGARDRYEARHFLAEASLLRAFTHVPDTPRGGEGGLYRDRHWPWTEAVLMILGFTGVITTTQGRRRIEDWLNRPKEN